ncbi:unnamed protein product [Trichobilharzia szidati]|nr:unnamed protein product [Trichobilharzia szidati]
MQKKSKYKIWLSEFIQLCRHHLPPISEEANTAETLSDKDYQLIEDTLKNIIEDIQQKIQRLQKENNEMENILVDAQTISQSFSTKVKPSITGKRLYYLKSRYHDFGINDATNLKQMKRLRDYLCKTKLALEKSLQEEYKLKSDIATSQKNVQHLLEKVNCQKKVNKALKNRIERLKVCLNSWKLEQEHLPAKCIGECILVALYNHINSDKNKAVQEDDNGDLPLSLLADQSVKGNNSENIENNVNSQYRELPSPSLSKRCSITVTQFTQLLQTGRNNEAFSLINECGEENCDLLTQLFKVCESISRNQRKDDILRQFVVSIFQKDIEDAEDNCDQHQTKFTQNLIKLSIPILLDNGYDNLLMKWIKRNISMINESIADIIFKSNATNTSIIEYSSYIYETICENIYSKIIKLSSSSNNNNYNTGVKQKSLETLKRCRTKCLRCLLIVRKVNHILKLLDNCGLCKDDESNTTEYPEKELFNLLLKCNCPQSADIFHHLLENDKISWKSFGLLLEEQMHKINSSMENNIDDSYGNMRVTVLLADLVNILLSDVELKDQHKILEMIVQKLEINSVSFWKNLLENNPSNCRDVCKLCGAFEIVKVRQLHIRRMVHLVQLAISGISTVDTPPE